MSSDAPAVFKSHDFVQELHLIDRRIATMDRSLFFKTAVMATLLPGLDITQDASAQSADTETTQLLKQRSAEFEREVIRVTDGVYTAVGYSVQPVTMIVGDDGLIIVDTGMDTPSAEQVLTDFRKISKKPIAAVILTDSHGDHQWTAQLCDHLLALDPDAKEPMLLKADALEAAAENVLSGIGRNYYLTIAQELRQAAK